MDTETLKNIFKHTLQFTIICFITTLLKHYLCHCKTRYISNMSLSRNKTNYFSENNSKKKHLLQFRKITKIIYRNLLTGHHRQMSLTVSIHTHKYIFIIHIHLKFTLVQYIHTVTHSEFQ